MIRIGEYLSTMRSITVQIGGVSPHKNSLKKIHEKRKMPKILL